MKIFRLILLILHVGISILLIGIFMNAYVPPKMFPWFNLLSLGFPLLIIAYTLITIFWIFSLKKRVIVFILYGLLFINPIKRWINFSSSEKKEVGDLKIVSFNVKGGEFGKEVIEKYINDSGADIVLLQERGRKGFDFKDLKTNEEIPVVSLYSKYKIINHKGLIIGDFEDFNAYADQTDIEIKGHIYRFVNVYLQPFKFEKSMVKLHGNEEDEQKLKDIVKRLIPTFKRHQEQIEIIRKAIDNSPYPVILAGDFNSVPNSYEYYHLPYGLKDAFFEAGRGSATSFHDYTFPLRIDYVFSSPSIVPTSYKVDRSVKISDHYPVLTTFKISN
ncbi:AP endonuclease [Chryseobacterium nematophagum]|uniref:AP endonuclease n=2 Tax=Chryseobacterium nematophagum TaxID=2305228 RepID=A0A3M7TN84_9FLAO|nr:AP endonuclease [Chryseobacterium nematophagum]